MKDEELSKRKEVFQVPSKNLFLSSRYVFFMGRWQSLKGDS